MLTEKPAVQDCGVTPSAAWFMQQEPNISNQQKFNSVMVLNRLLLTSLDQMPLKSQLQEFLKIILDIPWFKLVPKGGVFLVDEQSGHLHLMAQQGFLEEQKVQCAVIKLGDCLCGRVLQSQSLLFADKVDHQHDFTFEGMVPHGHYVVPIMDADKLLGVLNLYLEEGHPVNKEEQDFLGVVASTVACLIKRRYLEHQLKLQVERDKLTGLPNRSLFLDRLSQSMYAAKRHREQVVLMFIDLDRFKWVNDTLGHDAGDDLLREVAIRIKSCVRQSDTVARLGGDEFTTILTGITHPCYVELVARKILEQLTLPFQLCGQNIFISCSIGISVYPDDAELQEDLLKSADSAMYESKNAGRGTFHFYHPEMQEKACRRVEIEASVREGLEKGEFYLVYQPKINLGANKVEAVEALVRWEHKGELKRPDDFIPVAGVLPRHWPQPERQWQAGPLEGLP